MSETEPASEEATMTANGSGPPSERASAAAVSEKKDKEEKNGVDEKKDSEENKDLEGKKEKENGMKMVEDAEEERQDKKTENVIPAEPEDVKMVDADDSRKVDAEDVKMVDAEVVKDEGEKGKEIGEEERLKPEEENNVRQEKDDEETEKQVDENQGEEGSKKKRMRGPKVSHKGEAKEKKGGETKSKEPSTPVASSIERPVRERKTVERLVEVIEKGPNRDFLIEKGRGTPLKDIPNVAYKLARKKPADLKLLHQTLFGRRGKAVDFKNHILQFSGFVWHESDEKQKAKMKEKLDKYVKDTLLDLCDLFDISVSRATTRKEDLVAKLLDFMAAPHAQTDVILAEREQSAKSRKRKRVAQGSASKSMGSTSAKRSRKKHSESEGTPHTKERNSRETDDEDEEDEKEDDENGIPDEEETPKRPESEVKESESEEEAEEDEDDEEHSGKVKRDNKRSPKQQGSVGTEKSKLGISSRKAPHRTTGARSPIKRSSSKRFKAQEDDIVGEKVFSRKKKDVEVPKKKSNAKQDSKEKGTGEKVIKGKVKPEAENPSKEELRKKICTILKEVDFNTATFTDILKQLATHYKVDLTPRKAAIKLMIQEELTKLADEDEENEDEEDAEEGNPEPAANEVEA